MSSNEGTIERSADASSQRMHVRPTTSTITWANRWDHLLARWAFQRDSHRVEPGLYALGGPTPDSPVFVTANYTLSYDALRSALAGIDSYILVLDTKGINVWCAAGKRTFGTEELVHRIRATGLEKVVSHRRLILPQLGAPGVAAHEVKRQSGFQVEYGPVRARDLPGYLDTGSATVEMRRTRFTLIDRLVLVPLELVMALVPLLIAVLVSFFLGGATAAAASASAILAGVVIAPLLLPWIPTRDFSTKGLMLGLVVALPFAVAATLGHPEESMGSRVAQGLSYLLALPPITAFLALNFTGSTTFTSRSGVKREIYRYVPVMAGLFVVGLLTAAAALAVQTLGGF